MGGSQNGVSDDPVTTDTNGHARPRYPKYVFEKIETGTICLSVDHPDFVLERLEQSAVSSPRRNRIVRQTNGSTLEAAR
jgi:hypothetical protein